MIRMRFYILARKLQKWCILFTAVYQGENYFYNVCLIASAINFSHMAYVVFASFFQCKFTMFPLETDKYLGRDIWSSANIPFPLKLIHCLLYPWVDFAWFNYNCGAYLTYNSTLLSTSHLLIETLFVKKFPLLFICLLNYIFISIRLMDIYFILQILIKHCHYIFTTIVPNLAIENVTEYHRLGDSNRNPFLTARE